MKKNRFLLVVLLIVLVLSLTTNVQAQTATPAVVRAVLFYSPICGHCEYVINNTLLPLIQKYGDQLQIIGVDVTQQKGQILFQSAAQKFGLESYGVPFLVIEDIYLIGSTDIPEKFPGMIEEYIKQGGTDWPDIPGLSDVLVTSQDTPEPTPTSVPVVHALLFYRSSCSHCKKVVEEVIPPLTAKYENQLDIFGVDVSSPEGDAMFSAAIERFHIEQVGVPTLILGDQVLVGGVDIEERFASLIDEYLGQGGKDWPDISGLTDMIAASKADQATATASAQSSAHQTTPIPATDLPNSTSPTAIPGINITDTQSTTWRDKFAHDPAGNTVSVVVLLGMIVALIWTAMMFKNTSGVSLSGSRAWIIPLICVIGFAVAGYLTYIEMTDTTAVCGPVGDCNTVQQSEYAILFGILPVGLLGLLGYIAILFSWFTTRIAKGNLSNFASLAMFGMTVFGTLFSIYLTFLEPFVIGASCAWCLTSAVLMTVLMLLTVRPAKAAIQIQS